MTKEEKELLLKDLCARLPYGVIIYVHDTFPYTTLPCFNMRLGSFVSILSSIEPIFKTKDKLIKKVLKEHTEYLEFKPYLRPMSSMTEEERNNLRAYCRTQEGIIYDIGVAGAINCPAIIDFLNKNHFDYRGLIEKGLALEAPEGTYSINN
jgi:hypothetical protein